MRKASKGEAQRLAKIVGGDQLWLADSGEWENEVLLRLREERWIEPTEDRDVWPGGIPCTRYRITGRGQYALALGLLHRNAREALLTWGRINAPTIETRRAETSEAQAPGEA